MYRSGVLFFQTIGVPSPFLFMLKDHCGKIFPIRRDSRPPKSIPSPFALQMLPIGGPGRALSARQQAQLLFDITGNKENLFPVPIALMDGLIGIFDFLASIFPSLQDPAEFAKVSVKTCETVGPFRKLAAWPIITSSVVTATLDSQLEGGCENVLHR